MLLSRHQNVGQNRDMKIENRSFENLSHFKHLGTTVKNQNLIRSRTFCLLVCCRKTYKLEYTRLILPIVLYGCETWSLKLREEHRLRVFENRLLRRIFGPKGDEVTGEWRKLHNEEPPALYWSPSIIRILKSRRMRWAGHVARIGKKEHVQVIGGNTRGKKTTRKTKT
jgi:hypothetical protein